ncbi:MAG: TIGR03790 family protein [Verrucomicrobiae bacterium]|nr:TIGR03790 family protein [Verrucomicrobiae bacterium]
MTRWTVGLIILMLAALQLPGGGSGLNVVVVVNENSTNSVQLGNYYCEQRRVPPQNFLRINWNGGNTRWTKTEFETHLRAPLLTMLTERQLTNQIDFVLLSMDIPYRVGHSDSPEFSGTNSTTSALHYGFKPDGLCPTCPAGITSCSLPDGSGSAYAGSEGVFRQSPPMSQNSNTWLVMMLTSSNLAQAKATVDRGVASDFSFPTQKVFLIHYEDDPFRGVRYAQFDDAIFDSHCRAAASVVRTNTYTPSLLGPQAGSQFGRTSFALPADLFVPGALADNLTSFGGMLFEGSEPRHTGPLHYLNAGATASYGTVVEPCNYLEKFPSPRNYFYQARGFTAAECYYLSVTNPYQGLLVGEPLAAPFARPGEATWLALPNGAVLTGATNLTVEFTAADASRPVQQVDLFLNGTFARTLTNIAPSEGNRLHASINGHSVSYTVPNNATLQSVASNLAARLNTPSYTNVTKVAAAPRGDRIELRGLDMAVRGDQTALSVSNTVGTATALTTQISASRDTFLESTALGRRNFMITNTPTENSYLQMTVTRTNGEVVSVSVTNAPGSNNTGVLIKQLVDAINTNAVLMTSDGVMVEDFVSYNVWLGRQGGEFNLLARSPGWPESQVQARLTGSANFAILPSNNLPLDENVSDLQPRNHLYLTAGLTELPLPFTLDTTTLPDGHHELTVVAYEGSHVRTQTRVSRFVRVQNTSLAATFASLMGDTNTALEATLQFAVAANTSDIARIELFSTGGALGTILNESAGVFAVAASQLGIGLHPFYCMVTRADDKSYRTETKWIRIIGDEPPFSMAVAGAAPTLSWPATAGRRYEVLSTTNVATGFSLRDAVTPTNVLGQWSETNNAAPQRHYRVRATP